MDKMGVTVLLATLALLANSQFGLGQGGPGDPGGTRSPAGVAELPVTRVVLFTSGVGYFEHEGTVDGSVELDLRVASEHMDDLLQSLVLEDLDGGSIRPVRYPSRDPLGRILAGYSLDLSGNPGLAEILAQARGEAVRLEAAEPIEGIVVDVEQVDLPDEGPTSFVTLLTPAGLRRVALDEVGSVRFESEALRSELQAALEAVARHRGSDDKPVRLRFEGSGTRRVRVGYVREMPVWKTSYRLLLGDGDTAELHGWAIFDNPTNDDLVDVSVSFVAGQPLSFVTELFEPLYLDRPRVPASAAPALAPPAYAAEASAPLPQAAPSALLDAALEESALQRAASSLSGAGVEAMARAVRTGAAFAYRVSEPVTIRRHESAMVPIVRQRVETRRVSVYDPAVLPSHPLRGVRLLNDTGLHLAAGPVSVFDESGFVGNSRIADIVPGESRLLTFAVDLEVEVQRSDAGEPERVTAVAIRNGLVEASYRQRLRSEYLVSARGSEPRLLIIEHRKPGGFQVTSPQPAPSETADSYRFGVALAGEGGAPEGAAPSGGTSMPIHLRCEAEDECRLEVVLERADLRTLAVGELAREQVAFYLENVELSAADRAALARIHQLQTRIADLDSAIAELDARLEAIYADQGRIRQNMGALDRNSTLYRRYVSELERQEDLLETIATETEALQGRRRDAQQELDAAVGALGGGAAR